MPDANDLLPVLKIQRFSTQDGPGVRTTVFLKGCPLRCVWCHNPESQSPRPEIFYTPSLCIGCRACAKICPVSAHSFSENQHIFERADCTLCLKCCSACPAKALESVSENMTVTQILEEAKKDICFYGIEGGLTLSGGEPMLHASAALGLLSRAKENGINTVVETCGFFEEKYTAPLADTADLLLWDLKSADPAKHIEYTGVSNRQIIKNLYSFDKAGGKTVLRCIMLQGVNTDEESLQGIVRIYRDLKNCRRIEIFSYRHHAEGKYAALGRAYHGDRSWAISQKQLKNICTYFKQNAVRCTVI